MPVMDTYVDITALSPYPDYETGKIIKEAFDAIKKIESLVSSYKDGSEVDRLNLSGAVEASPQTLDMVKKAIFFSEQSGGVLDITYKPVMDAWNRAAGLGRVPDYAAIREAASLVDYRRIAINGKTIAFKKKGMAVDLSCIAKGYAVDRAVEALNKHGIKNALVNAGGDIYALGRAGYGTKWHIGIQDPGREDNVITVIALEDMAVATSGGYERYYEIGGKRYSTIFNPVTGRQCDTDSAGATVIAKDCATADALSTACYILGGEEGVKLINKLKGVECMIVNSKGDIFFSARMREFLIDGISSDNMPDNAWEGGEAA